ncbi:MAG: tripartite tricarboxylate transporter substrate binding protein [Acetobacteraceae bacterium]|nr:tripartite tricarboxylate transporter substrate binding protein [Acetobacteraceae bacterium]
MTRRWLMLFGAALCLAAGQLAPAAQAQTATAQAPQGQAGAAWPTRAVRIVVVFPPGGASDIVARILAEMLTPRLGQRVVVDNRPGAGGTLAAAHVAQQPADGYTLLLSNTAPIATSPPLYSNPGYDPLRSFVHVAFLGATTMVVVTNLSVPAQDMAGLMAWLRAQPQPVTFGTSGVGSVGHVLGSMFSAQTGIALNHAPYRGSMPMQADLLGGSILLSFDTLPENVENIRAGRLRAHAVSAPARVASIPAVPTTAEAGLPGLLAENWLGVSAPAGLPEPVQRRLAEEIGAIVASPAFAERMATVGIVPRVMGPAEFTAFVAREVEVMGGAVRRMGIRND